MDAMPWDVQMEVYKHLGIDGLPSGRCVKAGRIRVLPDLDAATSPFRISLSTEAMTCRYLCRKN